MTPEDRVNRDQPIGPGGTFDHITEPIDTAAYRQPPAPPQPYQPSAYAAYAGQPVVINVNGDRGCNHALHAVATMLTCGFWSPIWVIDWARRLKW